MTLPNYALSNRNENMETKISNMISRLKITNASFFHKATKKAKGPFAYALEFPKIVEASSLCVGFKPLRWRTAYKWATVRLDRDDREEEKKACVRMNSFGIVWCQRVEPHHLISHRDERNIPYFYKVMTKSAVTEIVHTLWFLL